MSGGLLPAAGVGPGELPWAAIAGAPCVLPTALVVLHRALVATLEHPAKYSTMRVLLFLCSTHCAEPMPLALSARGVAETGGLLFGRVFPSVVGISWLVARFSSAAPVPHLVPSCQASRPFLERALHVNRPP